MKEIRLLDTLNAAVWGCIGSKEIGIAFSGGLDSALIAFLAKRYARVKGYTVGVVGSGDIGWGSYAAHLLGIQHQKIELSEEEVLSLANELSSITTIISPLVLSYELPIYTVLKIADEKTILTGAGADELFGGYKRYLRMDSVELEVHMKRDLEKAVMEREIERKVAVEFGKQLCTPYLNENVVKFAFSLPSEQKISGGRRKVILRECAKVAGLPYEIYEREKKASQYSSGLYKILRKKNQAIRELTL